MQIKIEIPDALAHRLEAKWGNLERKALELLVIEAYRDVLISGGRARELLGFATRLELDAFLKEKGVYLHYDMADLEQDLHTMEELKQEGKLKR
jgi:predicted HTH domain antitoxin